ncbi:Membrane-associated protease RseP, regulator of RpoE activity [Thermomonospora echinospora]|uniref:Membrane-associated protease RseP, regulator of RpoE activity n=1 Tax=Thermomonospora echinospora TaxID=1992 RepID=A0A1H5VR61_9ACTN|nr:site-2 protease family protein [Thermomonospora echinospora]SEF89017.1 Membrane-associated protease RseP, regulator of RpoE activity [Thermomonospora echinospora]
MESLIVLGGALLFFLLLMLSIALHELGHFSFAKLFGVRTTQFMVGFGPTMWSRHKGETEYGIKWLPFGGYIRMIGMLPPRKGDLPGPDGVPMARTMRTGPFQGLIDSARGAALEEVGPGDGDRVFYAKKWWQKLLIMFAGPAMNIMLAVLFFAILIMGFGVDRPQPVISTVSKCTIPAAEAGRDCRAGEPLTPAAQVGLRPGDRFVSYDGRRISDYEQLQKLIRGSGGRTVPIVVEGADGARRTLDVAVTTNKLRALDDPDRVETVGFLGISPLVEREQLGLGAVAEHMGEMTERTVVALAQLPQRMVGVWHAAFGGEERDPEGPIGVVGASRIGGEIIASEHETTDKIAWFISVLAAVNFGVGMFNLIPLLPLDGGHIAGALWEAVKRAFAKLFRRPDPGYVDVAKALPITYVMACVMLFMGALLIYADLVNPIHFSG